MEFLKLWYVLVLEVTGFVVFFLTAYNNVYNLSANGSGILDRRHGFGNLFRGFSLFWGRVMEKFSHRTLKLFQLSFWPIWS